MAGSVLFGVLFVIVLLLVVAGIASPGWLIPVFVVGIGLLVLIPVLGRLRGSSIAQPDGGPSGVPTTREAAYEPVQDPRDRGST